MRRFYTACSLLFFLSQIGMAGVLFKTGFDANETPPYSIGNLVPQNGWFQSTVAKVQTAVTFSGTQAVQFNAAGTSGQNVIGHNLSDPLTQKLVVADVHFQQSATGSDSVWTPLGLLGNS